LKHKDSPRTQRRHIRADRQLQELLGADSYFEKAVVAATRPNGSLNRAKMLRIMEDRAVFLLAQLPEDP
jgi:hypothetical protein